MSENEEIYTAGKNLTPDDMVDNMTIIICIVTATYNVRAVLLIEIGTN